MNPPLPGESTMLSRNAKQWGVRGLLLVFYFSILEIKTYTSTFCGNASESIAYHFVQEGATRDEWRMAYVNMHQNPVDILTKNLLPGEKRTHFVRMLLHHIYDDPRMEE